MFLLIVLFLVLIVFVFCKITESSANPKKAELYLVLGAAFFCWILDQFLTGLGFTLIILLFIGYLWFGLYNKK